MVDMNNLMKQAQAMKEKMEQAQKELSSREYEGESGGGLISITLTGEGEMKSIKIDPSLCNKDEIDMLEDLVITAFKNAKHKLDEDKKNSVSGLLPPGMKMPF